MGSQHFYGVLLFVSSLYCWKRQMRYKGINTWFSCIKILSNTWPIFKYFDYPDSDGFITFSYMYIVYMIILTSLVALSLELFVMGLVVGARAKPREKTCAWLLSCTPAFLDLFHIPSAPALFSTQAQFVLAWTKSSPSLPILQLKCDSSWEQWLQFPAAVLQHRNSLNLKELLSRL